MSNKISEEHFNELTALVNQQRQLRDQFTSLSIAMFNLEEQRDVAMLELRQTEDAIDKMRDTLTESYGEVNIDLTDGSIKEIEKTEE